MTWYFKIPVYIIDQAGMMRLLQQLAGNEKLIFSGA